MKKGIIAAAAVLAAIIAGLATTSAAQASYGYVCKYQASGVVIVLDGRDNGGGFCRAIGSGLSKFYGTPRGGLRCRYESTELDVRVSLYSSSSWKGRLMCRAIGPAATRGGLMVRTR